MAQPCPNCGSTVPTGFAFCGHCGTRMEASPPPPPPPPPPPAGAPPAPASTSASAGIRIIVLRGPVAEGSTFPLKAGRTSVGRNADVAFTADGSLDDVHIVLEAASGRVEIVDVPGESGVWRRIREPVTLSSGETIFAGEQYLIVRRGDDAPRDVSEDGGEVPEETFGTPLPAPQVHVTQLLAGGLPGRVASTDKASLSIGRENCDLSFPQDRFMSGRHLRLERSGEDIALIDVGSLNGTFAPVSTTPVELGVGDEVMVGSVLFRIDAAD
ncbi:MAG: hypothetical protein RIT45_287 [Pseudomonadota bacterium]